MKVHYSHRLSSTKLAQLVGTFVLVPLLGLVVVGIFMAKAEHLFEDKYLLHTSIGKSYGLEPGAPVLVSGIKIGRVAAVEFADQGAIDVTLQLLSKYQDKVREDSVARVLKSGLFVGQAQIGIAMGSRLARPLPDGGMIRSVEPQELGDLVNDVKPVLESVQRTLLRIESVTNDVHTAVQTGGRVLGNVEQVSRELPALAASVHRAVESVERTTATLPEVVGSAKRTLAVAEGVASDVRAATKKLPMIIETTQEAIRNIKTSTESMKGVSHDLPRLVQTAHAAAEDVQTILRGAKKTFPVSTMVKNAESTAASRSGNRLMSLRDDQVGR